jgi:5'-methylthioadenosine phosphorylase
LGIISGTVPLEEDVVNRFVEKTMENEFGLARPLISDAAVFIHRHGSGTGKHILPHLVNHAANLKALKDLGVEEVYAVNSAGSLKRRLKPGTLVVPDDFIMLERGPTTINAKSTHITPKLSEDARVAWLAAAGKAGIEAVNGGVYWQTAGPRLETRAEIGLISQFADLVGMTMGSEAIVAQELGLAYASLCSVDNYAHGLEDRELTMEKILWHARRNAEAVATIVKALLETKAGAH